MEWQDVCETGAVVYNEFTIVFETEHWEQLREKIIPAFEKAHGPGYQALIMVDNSQGHSAYGVDALLTSHMNLRPGGKQAQLRDGWFIHNGEKVIHPMIFPPNRAEFPDQPNGIGAVLIERGLWVAGLTMNCKKCEPEATTLLE